MSNIKTYYLIDFENVHEEGLSGSDKLGAHDHIHIFSTQNAPKISFKELALLNSTEHFSHIIPAGRQSLDMHLVAYLGYLIGKDDHSRYVIVSKDTDFDPIIAFLKKDISPHASITRQAKISDAPPKSSAQKASDTPSKSSAQKTGDAPPKGSPQKAGEAHMTAQQKIALNTEIQRTVSNAGYTQPVINEVASMVAKHYGEDNSKQAIYRAIIKKYGQKPGQKIYRHIRSHI